jgi:predicted kinase
MENKLTAYVLIGAPGSGKSTYAAKLAEKENAVVISGDDIRAELYGDAAIQGDWGEIWERIEERVSECCGMNVILDGTHYRSAYRKEAITLLRSYGYEEIEAVVIDAPLDRCIMRNAARQRNVPRYVLVEMWEKLQVSLKNISNEDFSHINFIY